MADGSGQDMMSEEDATVRQFRIKRLIESLESARGFVLRCRLVRPASAAV